MICLKTLPLAQTTCLPVLGRVMNSELEGIGEEVVVAWLLSQHLLRDEYKAGFIAKKLCQSVSGICAVLTVTDCVRWRHWWLVHARGYDRLSQSRQERQ